MTGGESFPTRQLLIGCGRDRRKKMAVPGREDWDGLVTLDLNEEHDPDVVHDLEDLPYPFGDEEFSEIHAYEVLEHVGRQGDYRFFFAQWHEFWRLLEDGGLFLGTVPLPASPWAWGDPSHTRVLPRECLIFLDQDQYGQIGETPMTDFRTLWKGDFKTVHTQDTAHHLLFVLKAVKP